MALIAIHTITVGHMTRHTSRAVLANTPFFPPNHLPTTANRCLNIRNLRCRPRVSVSNTSCITVMSLAFAALIQSLGVDIIREVLRDNVRGLATGDE